jgi:hypothetical protein
LIKLDRNSEWDKATYEQISINFIDYDEFINRCFIKNEKLSHIKYNSNNKFYKLKQQIDEAIHTLKLVAFNFKHQ